MNLISSPSYTLKLYSSLNANFSSKSRKNNKHFTNAQEIHIIDLTKINSVENNERQKYIWGMLFKAETQEELELIAKESTVMADATEKLMEISADERAQAYADSRDYSVFAQRLHEYGLIEQRNLEIARNSLSQGLDIETISSITGLTVETLEKLRAEIKQ